ncbi:MAG TPA: S-adenosylmethionine:tRNA ribosyltransferase-isomerase, partial [Candidatus Brocadiia bacterium]|nr:S-adenosylmethionine:tRNA ribosyltransferase-isomerase [Candidatus Brocadiia bacterium]
IHRQAHDPRDADDRQRYQTIYAAQPGAVAAPTAGLHFTQRVFEELAAKGVDKTFVTLHVGAGTFRPISTPDIRQHAMHTETYSASQSAIDAVRAAQKRGGRVIPVGTTACRVLETLARRGWAPGPGETGIYLYPTCPFLAADALITNFHLPRSTLLVLVSAFAGRQRILDAYAECARLGYRFFSYGDAMLIV